MSLWSLFTKKLSIFQICCFGKKQIVQMVQKRTFEDVLGEWHVRLRSHKNQRFHLFPFQRESVPIRLVTQSHEKTTCIDLFPFKRAAVPNFIFSELNLNLWILCFVSYKKVPQTLFKPFLLCLDVVNNHSKTTRAYNFRRSCPPHSQ